ncbi:MAG: chorismate mutase [bacterium]
MERLDPIREEIDRIDEEILHLLNERARKVLKIVEIKGELGLPVYFPQREDEILRLVQDANGGPLSDTAVKRVFERIIDESRRLERTLGDEEDAGGGEPEPHQEQEQDPEQED